MRPADLEPNKDRGVLNKANEAFSWGHLTGIAVCLSIVVLVLAVPRL